MKNIEDIKDAREGDIATVEWGSTVITGRLRSSDSLGVLSIWGGNDSHVLRVRGRDGSVPFGVKVLRIERQADLGDLIPPQGYRWRPINSGHDRINAEVVVVVTKGRVDVLGGEQWGLFPLSDNINLGGTK